MPYRKQQFVNNEIYHIVTKSIDDNLLFKNKDDYYRGIFSIYEFNTIKPTTIQYRRKVRIKIKKDLDRDPLSISDERDKLVEIFAFCFMPNHIHLLLRQLKDGGITKFMNKFGAGYGGYFNRKYIRKGHVFQSRFLSVHVKNEDQLRIVFVYIHTNPAALIDANWKENGIKDPKKVIQFLENYKWSSYSDFISKNNFPSVTDRDFILEIMEGNQNCKNFVEDWIKQKGKIKEFIDIAIE